MLAPVARIAAHWKSTAATKMQQKLLKKTGTRQAIPTTPETLHDVEPLSGGSTIQVSTGETEPALRAPGMPPMMPHATTIDSRK